MARFSDIRRLKSPQPTSIVRYGHDSPVQFAEIWLPDGEHSVPVVVLIHGGCWQSRFGVDHVRPICHDLRQNDLAVVSLEYRRLGDEGGGWPGTFQDLMDGLSVLDHPRLHRERSTIIGHSAGGHLALWLASRSDPSHPMFSIEAHRFQSVFALAAVTDLVSFAEGSSACMQSASTLLQTAPDSGLINPAEFAAARNCYLVHGTDDTIVPLSQSTSYARRSGGNCIEMSNTDHFDLIHPRTAAWTTVREMILASLTGSA